MTDDSIRRRKLLACGLTAGLAGSAGCVRSSPDAANWAAGIRWHDPPGTVREERGFSTEHGTIVTGVTHADEYIRINGGERKEPDDSSEPILARRGDHVEYLVEFDSTFQGTETVFEYTIPDEEDLVGVLAGFAEARHYRGTNEWVVRPLNVDLETGFLSQQPEETLVVEVTPTDLESRDDRSMFVWGHTESIREEIRDWEADADVSFDLEFLESDEAATFSPAAYHRVTFRIADGAESIARVSYPEPDAER